MDAKRPYDVFSPACPSREAFDAIFSRWGILVLSRLSADAVRFGTLRRAVGGISEKMLAQTLGVLEEQGLVERHDWHESPPRVEYRLTASGLRLSARATDLIGQLYGELATRLA
jgi:DNA-binding HxlR family transcriptional regulator